MAKHYVMSLTGKDWGNIPIKDTPGFRGADDITARQLAEAVLVPMPVGPGLIAFGLEVAPDDSGDQAEFAMCLTVQQALRLSKLLRDASKQLQKK